MMMNHSLKNLCKVTPGTIVKGKWHDRRYTIIKELGFGANGIVYLAQTENQYVALKMSDNGLSITSEVNVLKSLAKVQGSALGPSLLDVDDWIINGQQIGFYVMEYIHGPDLLSFIREKGPSWTEVLILQLLKDLEKLHQKGWVFGDLKPENLIVTGPPPRIRCIDVGGTTIQGRAIKEFTEFFDRGYWGLGTRKATPCYDLFAVAMILINTAYPKRFNKTANKAGNSIKELELMIKQKKELKKYEPVIINALLGKYSNAKEMRDALLQLSLEKFGESKKVPQSKPRKGRHQQAAQNRQTIAKRKKKGGTFETALIVIIISLIYIFYIYGQLI